MMHGKSSHVAPTLDHLLAEREKEKKQQILLDDLWNPQVVDVFTFPDRPGPVKAR